ncbi:MAG: LeuA family protein [Candidatus Electrothrix sp. YB6]
MASRYSEIEIIDSTLREGEQTPSVIYTDKARQSIIAGLHRVQVNEIELGVAAAVHTHLPRLVKKARRITAGSCRLALWSRCLREDIAFAAGCRPDVLSLSVPVSDSHIQKRLRKERPWVKENLASAIRQALKSGIPFVSVGLEDASRAEPDFLIEIAQTAAKNGAGRIRLADTVGIGSPGSIAGLVLAVKEAVPGIKIGVHCHNDFGMGTANSIAALEAGADCLDATVLGIGERAGNCRLEEVIGFLSLVHGNTRYRPDFLPDLCRTVAKATGKSIADNHPLIGSEIFTCESGLHQHGLHIKPEMYEPYAPERVGGTRRLRFGSKTGRKAVQLQLKKAGIRLDETQIGQLVHRIRSGGCALNEEQLLRFAVEGC